MNSRLVEMIARGRLPFKGGGQWIDTYNQTTNPDCAGTIIAGINDKNHYYIMEEIKHETDTGQIRDDKPDCVIDQRGRGWNKGGVHEICPTITGGAFAFNNTVREPVILGWTRDKKGNIIDRHPVEVANAVTAAKRDNTQNYVIEQIRKKHPNRGIFWGDDGKAYCIRKLTPRECFRLMGVSDADINKIQAAGISKSQQCKMAGNSIVVNTLAAIFRQLFVANFNKVVQTEIF